MRALITIGKALDLLNISSQGSNYGLARFLCGAIQIRSGIFFWFMRSSSRSVCCSDDQNFRNLARRHFVSCRLAAGYFGFTVNTTVLHFLRDFGLILFVFFIGLQVGPSFFSSFRSGGVQLNLLTLLAVFLSLAVTVGLYFAFSDTVSLPQMLGVYFGAVTNTPGLGATQEALNMLDYKGEDIAVAYACAYPLGRCGHHRNVYLPALYLPY